MSRTGCHYLKTFLTKAVATLMNVIFFNAICQHLNKLHNSLIQYFPDDQHMILLQNHAWVKGPFKVQDR